MKTTYRDLKPGQVGIGCMGGRYLRLPDVVGVGTRMYSLSTGLIVNATDSICELEENMQSTRKLYQDPQSPVTSDKLKEIAGRLLSLPYRDMHKLGEELGDIDRGHNLAEALLTWAERQGVTK